MIRLGWKNELAAMLAAAVLASCGGGTGELQAYIARVKARPAEPIAPIPPVKTYTPYVYEGLTARDPFRSYVGESSDERAAGTRSGPRPDESRPRQYLERFELDTLAMVGTFAKDESYWALVRDPDGVVHRVAVQNHMGKNHGRVTRIQETSVDLTEMSSDGMGGWLVREASLALEGG